MAHPQKENGHTSIANDLVEALSKTSLTSYESRVLWALLIQTYGQDKDKSAISLSQFYKITLIPTQHIARTLNLLFHRYIITKETTANISIYGLQRNILLWSKEPPLSKELHAYILTRDNHKCVFCGSINNLQVDHIIPSSKNGGNAVSNLRTLCQHCNCSKGNR